MASAAFVAPAPLLVKRSGTGPLLQRHLRRSLLRSGCPGRWLSCERPPSAVATPVPGEDSSSPGPIIPPAAAAGAQALLDDLAERPQYYLNVSGVLLGVTLSVIVLSATVVALDGLPLVPDALRVVGLGYCFWFLGKFLLNGTERQRLQGEIDEFVDIVRGDIPSPSATLEGAPSEQLRRVERTVEKADADLVM